MRFYLKRWFALVCLIMKCVYAHSRLISWFVVSGIFRLLVQGQRRSFEIGKDGGPTLFTESFNRSTLGGLPSRREFLNLLSAFGRNCQFHTIAASATDGLH